jgi:hypothetical protein
MATRFNCAQTLLQMRTTGCAYSDDIGTQIGNHLSPIRAMPENVKPLCGGYHSRFRAPSHSNYINTGTAQGKRRVAFARITRAKN